MKIKTNFIVYLLLVGMSLFLFAWVVQAQEVKIRLHTSTYGIDGKILTGIAIDLINKKLGDLKTKSGRALADLELVGKNVKQGSLDFRMMVTFLMKKTYTARVKQINFSLVEGKPANVVVKDPEPIKIKRVREKGLYEDCKTKQKVQITSMAVFKMEVMHLD